MQEALKLQPVDPDVFESQAWLAYLPGKTEVARELFKQVWPWIEKPSEWTGWLEVYLPELLRDVPHTSADLSEINVLLKKAQEKEDKAALIQVYKKLLDLQNVHHSFKGGRESHSKP